MMLARLTWWLYWKVRERWRAKPLRAWKRREPPVG